MMRTFIALLVQAVLAGTALAQGAGASMEPAALADGTQKALVQQYCDKDGRFMRCLGVDIKKDAARCADLVRGNWVFCRRTFMMTAPASIPASDARGYTDNLADCLRSGAIAAAGKSAGAVDQCMAGAR
ncbi:MAG TPA: hypothetical protein VFB01_10855 [Burkholderiales bacterium]|nr:hypothetical protein [Burkholderiales bacterium]